MVVRWLRLWQLSMEKSTVVITSYFPRGRKSSHSTLQSLLMAVQSLLMAGIMVFVAAMLAGTHRVMWGSGSDTLSWTFFAW